MKVFEVTLSKRASVLNHMATVTSTAKSLTFRNARSLVCPNSREWPPSRKCAGLIRSLNSETTYCSASEAGWWMQVCWKGIQLLYCYHMIHRLATQHQDFLTLVNVDEVLVLDIRYVIECLVSNAVRLGIFCSLWIRVATSFHTQINNVR